MIRALGWLFPAHLASSALGGGKSPAGWQKLNTQAGWRAGELPRLSSWLGFLEAARPHLCEGPMMGHGLELAATGASSQPPKTEPLRRTARRRPRPAEVGAKPAEVRMAAGRVAASASITAGLRDGTGAECLRLPSQADRTLLNVSAKHRSRRRAPRHQTGREEGNASRREFSVPGLPEPFFQGRPVLGDRLIRRVTRTIDRYAPCGAKPRLDFGAAAGVPASTPAEQMLDPWSTLLDGPAADRDLLLGLTAFPSGTGVSKPHQPAREVTPDADRKPSLQQQETLGTTRDIKTPLNPHPGAGRETVSDVVAAGGAVSEEFRFKSPFPPAWMAGITRAEPRTAAPVRRVANSATPFDWNLESLSVAMKRILDEEARRHGIDV